MTLCRCRAASAQRAVAGALFAEQSRRLDTKGVVPKAGTLIDAALIEAAVGRPPLSEGKISTTDAQGGFTRRGQRRFFAVKAHLAVDLGSDLIRDAVLSGAEIGDMLLPDGLVQGDDPAAFMGEGYGSAPRREAAGEADTVAGSRITAAHAALSPPESAG